MFSNFGKSNEQKDPENLCTIEAEKDLYMRATLLEQLVQQKVPRSKSSNINCLSLNRRNFQK